MRRISAVENFSKRGKNTPSRPAFTLIELMIVVVVIAGLMALLLPAIQGSFLRVRITQVITEIKGLEGAIAQFKAVFGTEPPSRIRLYEVGSGAVSWASDPGNEPERARSVAFINKIWPNFNFDMTPGRDFDGNGTMGGVTILSGAECLVFFLGGGHVKSADGTYAMIGFSKNPLDPFAAPGGNESREGPFFEFKASQLKKSLNPLNPNAVVYVDPGSGQSAPYVYASSYDGRGYQTADLYVNSGDDLDDVYRSSSAPTLIAQKPKSCQIISPGVDGLYGAGGYFSPTASNHGLTNKADYDNITNFHGARLSE